MASVATSRIVAGSSLRFQDAYARVKKVVERNFPGAKEGVLHGMPGWTIALPTHLVPKNTVGTLDPRAIYVLMRDGKSGVTLHLWNPLDYNMLDASRTRLEKAGFDVMVGCLRWSKKGDYPVAQVADLLRGMKARLNPKKS